MAQTLALPPAFAMFAAPQAAANDGYASVTLGGLKTACLSRAELTRLMLSDCLAARRKDVSAPKLIFASNGHAIALAARDENFRATFEQADIVHADGQAGVFASRLLTATPIPERSATTDFIHDAAAAGAENGLRFFLLGATEEANAQTARVLEASYPGLTIVGRRHGYFGLFEEDEICDEINLTQPDVIWVGLSVPLEYEFAVRNKQRLKAGWLVTCGGCFNFVTGAYARAPRWMQAAGLEWLYRLAREPKRLFWRYAVTNPLALFLLLTRTNSSPSPSRRLCPSGRNSPPEKETMTQSVTLALAPPRLPAALRLAWRYGISTAGPLAVSGAHFLVSLVFLRTLPVAEFGIFSFVLVVSAFAMSISGAGLVLPATRSMLKGENDITRACFKLSLLAGAIFAVGLTLAVMAIGARFSHAMPLGLFGAVLAYRWFARSLAYIEGRIAPPILSDLIYGAVIAAGLGFMLLSHAVSLRHGGLLLLLAATASLAPFGKAFFVPQWQGLREGHLRNYLPAFRNVTSWSLLGVALTEATLNAHAYLVTFIAGPGAFALPALGMLLMRPVSLVQSALPDLERPAMMRALAARDGARLARILREFGGALFLVLLATLLLAAAIFTFAPQWLLRHNYSLGDVLLATAICAAIMAVRSLRAPPALLLQAAGEFKALARIGGVSAAVSVSATLCLLLAFGPIASLGGILLGDIVILRRVLALARVVRDAHV